VSTQPVTATPRWSVRRLLTKLKELVFQ
jgi:hypothetical protein